MQVNPYLGLAPYFGAPLFSFVTFWAALAGCQYIRTRKIDPLAVSGFAFFVAANIIVPLNPPGPKDTSVNLRLVQGNIGNYIKVDAESGNPISSSEVYDRFARLSVRPSAAPIDLVLWPETAIPDPLDSSASSSKTLPPALRDIFKTTGTPLVSGGYDTVGLKPDGSYFETQYNAVFFFDEKGNVQNAYHKRLLIPFGESLPFGRFNKYFSDSIENLSFFARGGSFTPFRLKDGTLFVPTVCYEVLFPRYIADFLKSSPVPPRFIVNLANDSWYGDSAEPEQHKFLAHWRALEFNIPLVRMTNTGITSILYPDGSESKNLGIFKEGVLDVPLRLGPRTPTLFERFGILPTILLALLFSAVGFSWGYASNNRPGGLTVGKSRDSKGT